MIAGPEPTDQHVGPGWRPELVRGGARLAVVRAASLAALLLALIGLFALLAPSSRWAGALAAALTLAAGAGGACLAEQVAMRRGWSVPRGCDLVIVISTASAAAAVAQLTYAEAAVQGGPAAGLAAVGEEWTPGQLPPLLLAAAAYWGLPAGLLTFHRHELRGIWRQHPALALLSVATCAGGAIGFIVQFAAYELAACIDAGLGDEAAAGGRP